MRFLHLADLHLGKRVNDFSMLKDQEYVLGQVVECACREQVDGVLVAGDVFDKSVPSVEAVLLLDRFLTDLSGRGIPVFLISGNHDSAERLSFGARLMEKSGVYLAAEYRGKVERVSLRDAYGAVDVYLLPFLKPAHVRAVWKEEAQDVSSYQEALSFVLKRVERVEGHRSVLLAHQFVAGAAVCDSEEHAVGGLDQVDVSCFDGFDYVALGHLHGPQRVRRETIRYAGTLLKYSFSEVGHKKCITLVELMEKGNVQICTCPVRPLHEMREIRGRYEDITGRASYEGTDTADYVRVTLTDEEDIFDAVGKLRAIYPNLMRLAYENTRTGSLQNPGEAGERENRTPMELAEELFFLQNNHSMTEGQRTYMHQMIERVWEERP